MDIVNKSRVRQEGIKARLALTSDEVREKSHKIMETLLSLEEFYRAKAVMFYVDMRNEVETKAAIEKTLALGKRVVVPRVKKGYGLLAIEIKGLDELELGTFDVLEPIKNEEIPLEDIDLVVVPGVAFNTKGYRLGYGGGYYDNFLPKLRGDAKKVAVAFDLQLVETLPTEPHDVRMDMIITESHRLVF